MHPFFTGSHRQPRKVQISGTSSSTQKSGTSVLDDARYQRQQRELDRVKNQSAIIIQSKCRTRLTKLTIQHQSLNEFNNIVMNFNKEDIDAYTRLTRLIALSDFSRREITEWVALTLESLDNFIRLPHSLISLAIKQIIRSDVIDDISVRRFIKTLSFDMSTKDILLNFQLLAKLIDKLEEFPFDTCKTNQLFIDLTELLIEILPQVATIEEIQQLLSMPHLPTRIQIIHLAKLSSIIPYSSLLSYTITQPAISIRANWSLERRASFVGNILTFCKPRVSNWEKDNIKNWLICLSQEVIDLPELNKVDDAQIIYIDSDDNSDDDDNVKYHVKNSPTNGIHPRLLKRLEMLTDKSHIKTLLLSANKFSSIREQLFNYFAIIIEKYPKQRDDIIHSILYAPASSTSTRSIGGSGIIRELWRSSVRGSLLARSTLKSHNGFLKYINKNYNEIGFKENFLGFLLLVYLYSRLLITLPDADFHSQNQVLSIDEVISLSSILRNATFSLYSSAESIITSEIPLLRFKFTSIRSILTKLARQIHQRDSRKSFTTSDHWLMTSELDLKAFCEAVILEERKLEEQDSDIEMNDDLNSSRAGLRRYRNTKTLSKQQLAHISPKLGILNNIPFVIPFDTRVAIFREFIRIDEIRNNTDDYFDRVRADIRRDYVAEDGFSQLNIPGNQLKSKVFIRFFDQWGNLEAGIDGGGLFKEFLTSLAKEVFDTDRGLWLSNENRLLYPNPHSYAKEPSQLDWYRFLGKIIGKALYSGILLDVGFAGFFLAKWNGRQSHLDDLASLDPQLYDGLLYLKNYNGDPLDLSLTFAASEEEFGVTKTTDLIPNGQNVPVTRDNRIQYIHLISHYKLNTQIEPQCNAFFQGLSSIIDNKWLNMFDQQELGVLMAGTESDIDLDDLKKHTVYTNFSESDEVVTFFWSVLRSFSQKEKEQFLQFVTSCPRAPLLGFREYVPDFAQLGNNLTHYHYRLRPYFAISKSTDDESRLPTASTCVNLLKLPAYKTKEKLKQKLLAAITSGARFEMS